jgi:lipopolysaccharide transport system permease protein
MSLPSSPPADVKPDRLPSGDISQRARYALPEKPLVVIERRSRWAAIDLRGMWAYRELFYFLMWRDLKVRYRQTVLGAGWALLQPLLTMLIFAYVFGRLVKIPSDGIPYPVFAYTGLLTWTFFSNAVTIGSNSLVANTALITKVYFPRILMPAGAVCASLVDVGIAFLLLIPLMGFYDVGLSWRLAFVPAFLLLAAVVALAAGMLISAVMVRYRDARYVLPFMLQTWFFVSPIIYPSTLLPEQHQWLLALNPLTGIVEGSRAVLFGRPVAVAPLVLSIVMALALLTSASFLFRRAEKTFAEFI